MSDNCKARWFLYYYLVCCVTDLHIVPFRVSHNCLNPTDGVSAFIPPYFPRISTSPGPLPPPDSLTLILLCYYPAPSTGCFIFYFLPQYYGAWVADSQIVSVCLLFVCSTGEKGGVVYPFVYVSGERQCQSISASRKHPNRDAAGRGRGCLSH